MRALGGILGGAGIFALLLAAGLFDEAPPREDPTVEMGDLTLSPYVFATQRSALQAMDALPPSSKERARPIIGRLIDRMQEADADVVEGRKPADAAGFDMLSARQSASRELMDALPEPDAAVMVSALSPDPSLVASSN